MYSVGGLGKNYICQASSFCLEASLRGEVLRIQLKDYDKWTIYEKEYTDEDTEEIHKNFELADLYRIISGSFQKMMEQIEPYSFREMIFRDGTPCYKVQNGGKITVFYKLINITGEQQNWESCLMLNEIRKMTYIERITEKSKIQNLQNSIKQKKAIRLVELAILILLFLFMANINLQNDKILQELKQTKGNYKTLTQKHAILTQTYSNLTHQLQKDQLLQSLHQEEIKSVQLNQIYSYKFSIIQKSDIITVQYIGQNQDTNYFFDHNIQHKQVHMFKVRIVRITDRRIMLGVVDHTKQKYSRSSFRSNYAIGYWGSGYRWPGDQKKGYGFGFGETVEITVDRINNIVKWTVNGQQRTSFSHQMLGDQQRVFVPYIEFYNTGDTVEYIK